VARPVVVVTRRGTPADPLALFLEDGAAQVRWLPTTTVLPPPDEAAFDEALGRVPATDWLVFTSRHAVEAVFARRPWAALRSERGRPRVAAVGDRTAELLAERGAPADVVPPLPGAAGLVAALLSAEGGSLAGRRVFWPRSDIAHRDLADGLAAAGATVVEAVAYRTVSTSPADLESFRVDLQAGGIDAVCFLSPSAAEGLASALGSDDLAPLRGHCLVASLGPTTSEALARLGAPPDVEAAEVSARSLAAALLARLTPVQGATR
jgi:uroporphyrinogen III methyltransferase/synthase